MTHARAASPAAAQAATCRSGRLRPAGLDQQPPAGCAATRETHRSATRRWRSTPSGPPSSATRGSWSRASRAASWRSASVGTYGALTTSTSTWPAEVGRQRVVQVARRGPAPAGRLRRAHATATGSRSAAYTSSAPGVLAPATAAPIAPGAAAQVDHRTDSPRRGRDRIGPGGGLSQEPHQQLGTAARHEHARSRRRPAARRRTPTRAGAPGARPATRRATTRPSSSGPAAASVSSAASSSAKHAAGGTQPGRRARPGQTADSAFWRARYAATLAREEQRSEQ